MVYQNLQPLFSKILDLRLNIICDSESQHMAVRKAILDHMVHIAHLLLFRHIPNRISNIQQYITETGMDKESTWGTNIEILTLAHLLPTCVFSYNVQHHNWQRMSPATIDRSITEDTTEMSMYINYRDMVHFEVVRSCISDCYTV